MSHRARTNVGPHLALLALMLSAGCGRKASPSYRNAPPAMPAPPPPPPAARPSPSALGDASAAPAPPRTPPPPPAPPVSELTRCTTDRDCRPSACGPCLPGMPIPSIMLRINCGQNPCLNASAVCSPEQFCVVGPDTRARLSPLRVP
jgi:hypothetical protein